MASKRESLSASLVSLMLVNLLLLIGTTKNKRRLLQLNQPNASHFGLGTWPFRRESSRDGFLWSFVPFTECKIINFLSFLHFFFFSSFSFSTSLLLSLKREKAAGVGATPGFTRSAQQFQLDKNISLYDSPGIIFSKDSSEAEAVLHNSVRVEQVSDAIAPIDLLLTRTPVDKLLRLYNIPMFHSTQEFLTAVAEKRGRYKSVRTTVYSI